MKEKLESLTAADFFEKLQQDKIETSKKISIIGMVKKSEGEQKTIEFAHGGNCSNWVTIPLELIEDVEIMETISCKDHTHPLVKLNLITPKTLEGQALIKLLEQFSKNLEQNQINSGRYFQRNLLSEQESNYNFPLNSSSILRRGGAKNFGRNFGSGFGQTLPSCHIEYRWIQCGSALPGEPPAYCFVPLNCCVWPNGSEACMEVNL